MFESQMPENLVICLNYVTYFEFTLMKMSKLNNI